MSGGAFAEYVVLPAQNVFFVPAHIDDDVAVPGTPKDVVLCANALLVTVPQLNDASEQLAFHLPTRSWWRYRDLPIVGDD